MVLRCEGTRYKKDFNSCTLKRFAMYMMQKILKR